MHFTLTTLLTFPHTSAHSDLSASTELGISIILTQRQNGDHVTDCANCLLSSSECDHTEHEFRQLQKFDHTRLAAPFHYPLRWLSALKASTGQPGHWALNLEEYSIVVAYKSDRMHQDADCLSRNALDSPDLPAHDSDACVNAIS